MLWSTTSAGTRRPRLADTLRLLVLVRLLLHDLVYLILWRLPEIVRQVSYLLPPASALAACAVDKKDAN